MTSRVEYEIVKEYLDILALFTAKFYGRRGGNSDYFREFSTAKIQMLHICITIKLKTY